MKKIIKRIFCEHEYIQDVKCFAKHTQSGKDLVFYYKFKCINCGKIIKIKMDGQSQIEEKPN